ncbi:hypothetical protein B0T26DRAFT_293064 [Lasiosphaeria miniovina]|uniref:Uncharacterized protein n=1 Tax=Lasiosphaeria miniovina TaxID=1954250 RepID=A0AA40DZL6_9PEZI|nr:uncharacterized protein B0T26DRAFT_293064 [Lasiosphaeria miniovina]KAK0717288.1 hypothetical protein B0T26DRAFT_293064 [Lasiosphaeria miniovina]
MRCDTPPSFFQLTIVRRPPTLTEGLCFKKKKKKTASAERGTRAMRWLRLPSGWKAKKHIAPGIRWSSPTQLLSRTTLH